MDVRDFVVVIPARYRSTRLPGKPLVDIAGVPMVVRTARRAVEAVGGDNVVVATDDARIARVCQDNGICAEMTSESHPTGGDRVAELVDRIPARTYINLQGDEPIFNPSDITRILEAARSDRTAVLTGFCAMPEEEWLDSKFPRLIFGLEKNLIYIGRARVPASKDGAFRFGFRHVCVYAYPGEALKRFTATEGRTPIESIEDHEVMRFLELGMPVSMVELSDESVAVDREQDIQRVVERLAAEDRS